MFDNLREDANNSPFDGAPFYEDAATFEEAERRPAAAAPRRRASLSTSSGRFLGMTPLQRFILAFMLLMAVCALGSMCLLITGKISLL